ncbi:hypothetical protein COEX109129_10325 [Corallococcus exiguus]
MNPPRPGVAGCEPGRSCSGGLGRSGGSPPPSRPDHWKNHGESGQQRETVHPPTARCSYGRSNLDPHALANALIGQESMGCLEKLTMRSASTPERVRRQRRLRMAVGALIFPVAVALGGCSHAQRPEHRTYVISEDTSGMGGSGGRDCDAEHIQCFDRCWNSVPPLSSIKRGSGKHHEYCTEECRKQYMVCINGKEQKAQRSGSEALRFSNIDGALDWLRAHRTEVAIGTVVVVAGVAFVVATGGTGALVLAPLAL